MARHFFGELSQLLLQLDSTSSRSITEVSITEVKFVLWRRSSTDINQFRCGHSIQVCSTNTVVFAQYKGCSRLVGRKKSTHVVVFIQYKAG